MRWTGHVVRMGKRTGVCRVLVRKPEERRPLENPRHRWEGNIKTDLREVGWRIYLDLFGSGYGQLAGSYECGNEPSGSIKCG